MEEFQTRPTGREKTQGFGRRNEPGTWRTGDAAENLTRKHGFIIHGRLSRVARGIVRFLDRFQRDQTVARFALMQIRAVLFGLGLLQASMVAAKSQPSVQNADHLGTLPQLVETGVGPLRTGALTLEPRGLDASMRAFASGPVLLAVQESGSASAHGGTLLGKTDDFTWSSKAPLWQEGATSWATFDPTGSFPCLLDLKNARRVERNFETRTFGITALILGALLLTVRALFRSQIFFKLSRSPRSAVERYRAGHAATGLLFKRMVSRHAD